MRAISFEPESLVVPASGALYVLNRQGVFTIRAKNIDRLHKALKPHLDGTRDEAALLTAVAEAQRPMLRNYLIKMREAGALRVVSEPAGSPAPAALPADLPSADRSRGSFRSGPRSVLVSLDGSFTPRSVRHDAQLFVLTPEQAGRELLAARWPRGGAKLCYLVVVEPSAGNDPAHAARELERRAAYARWLLRHLENLDAGAGGVSLYRLDASTGALDRLWRSEGAHPSDWRTVPLRMGIVRPAAVEQIPLLVARASHPFFKTDLMRVGLRYDLLHEELLREFFVNALLGEGVEGVAAGPTVRASPLRLRAQLLEQYAEARTPPAQLSSGEEADLLREDVSHPDVDYLINVLRLRLGELRGTLAETSDGLFVYRCGARRRSSFLRAKALRDLLLAVVWDMFYSDTGFGAEPAPACDFESFVSDTRLRRVVREREARLTCRHGLARLSIRRLHCWGRVAWAGFLEGESKGERAGP